MDGYRVDLEAYSGPLDLLLFLVRKHEINLFDIPIAALTEQYLHHLELMRRVDIEPAGEFLVMAATLLEIKSRMLAPRLHDDETDSEDDGLPPDPRQELVAQLLAYKRYRDAGLELEERRQSWAKRLPLTPTRRPRDPQAEGPRELDLRAIDADELCEVFVELMRSAGRGVHEHTVRYDETPLGDHVAELERRLELGGPISLRAVLIGRHRGDLVGLFFATLELARQRKLRVVQDRLSDEVFLQPVPEEERPVERDNASEPPRNADGEIEYEWPSEELREIAERRATRRKCLAKTRVRQEAELDAYTEEDPVQEAVDADDFEADAEAEADAADASSDGYA